MNFDNTKVLQLRLASDYLLSKRPEKKYVYIMEKINHTDGFFNRRVNYILTGDELFSHPESISSNYPTIIGNYNSLEEASLEVERLESI